MRPLGGGQVVGIKPPLNSPQPPPFLGYSRKMLPSLLEAPQLSVLVLGHHRLFKLQLEQMKSCVDSEQKRQKGAKNELQGFQEAFSKEEASDSW